MQSVADQIAGKYLTFKLAGETYGLEILKVKEIVGVIKAVSVPNTPDYIRGVINLRGVVIPVFEMRKKFRMENISDTSETCIIVTSIRTEKGIRDMGIVVDSVSEVLEIKTEEIEECPDFGVKIETEFITGIAKTGGTIKTLLNIQKVLADGTADTKIIREDN